MNSRAPISELDRPSRASRAMWVSWGGQVGGGLDGAFTGGLAGGGQLAAGPVGERFDAHRGQHGVGGAQLLAGVGAAALPAQPFAVEEVGAGQLGAGLVQVRDRVAVELFGGAALAEQGSDEGLDPQGPFGGHCPGAFG
jgi:hypothetical protein